MANDSPPFYNLTNPFQLTEHNTLCNSLLWTVDSVQSTNPVKFTITTFQHRPPKDDIVHSYTFDKMCRKTHRSLLPSRDTPRTLAAVNPTRTSRPPQKSPLKDKIRHPDTPGCQPPRSIPGSQ
jgi:hypothetical protein